MLSISDADLRTLLICTFRYSLGRMTYAPQEAQELIKKHIHVLSVGDLEQFDKDIGEAAARGGLGMVVDVEGWLRFRQLLRNTVFRGIPPRGARPCPCDGTESCAYCVGGWVAASSAVGQPSDEHWTITHEVESLLEELGPSFVVRNEETQENDRRSVERAIGTAFRIGQQRAQR